jgi:hypothetical protein
MGVIRGYTLNIQREQRILDFVLSGKSVRLLRNPSAHDGMMAIPDNMYYISDIDIEGILNGVGSNRRVSIYIKNGGNPIPTGYIAVVDRDLKMASISKRVYRC